MSSIEVLELDDALLLRVGAFEGQLTAWHRAGRVGVPLLALVDAPAPAVGGCVSCGEPALRWRCSRCLEAAHEVLGLADLESARRLVPPRPTVHAVVAEIEDNVRDRHAPWEER